MGNKLVITKKNNPTGAKIIISKTKYPPIKPKMGGGGYLVKATSPMVKAKSAKKSAKKSKKK